MARRKHPGTTLACTTDCKVPCTTQLNEILEARIEQGLHKAGCGNDDQRNLAKKKGENPQGRRITIFINLKKKKENVDNVFT